MRQIANPVTQAWENAPVSPLPWPLQLMLMDDIIAGTMLTNMLELLMVPAGQISGMLTKRKSVKQTVDDMVEGAVKILDESFPKEVVAGKS